MRGIVITVIAIAVLIVLSMFFYDKLAGAPSEIDTTPPPTEPAVDQTPAPREFTIPVTVTKQFFNPATLTVNKGDTVILQLTSADIEHIVLIPAYGLEVTIAAGETKPLSFVATASGELPVVCADGCDPNVELTVTVN